MKYHLLFSSTDAESNKGNVVTQMAGKSLKQGKEIASKTAEFVSEKTYKYGEVAKEKGSEYLDLALQHWRTRMGEKWALPKR